MKTYLNALNSCIKQYNLLRDGDRVVVGVSGGPDSMALLLLFSKVMRAHRYKIIAAHMNHGLRKQAHLDERCVQRFCDESKIPLITETAETRLWAKAHKRSIEDAARELRYDFFGRVATKYRVKKIATAHTQDDQAETVLMHALRGSGLKGLHAMKPARALKTKVLIRPLLNQGKAALMQLLKSRAIPYRVDKSNASDIYFRNKIRNKLMPLLRKSYNSNIDGLLCSLGHEASVLYDFTAAMAEKSFKRVSKKSCLNVRFDIAKLQRVHEALLPHVIFRGLETVCGTRQQFTRKHLNALMALIKREGDQGPLNLPHSTQVRKRGNVITIDNKG